MKILDGNKVAASEFRRVKKDIAAIKSAGFSPRLAVVLVGDDAASLSYIGVKKKKARELGVAFDFHHFQQTLSQEDLCRRIVDINRTRELAGVIVQLPLPEKYSRQQILDCVLPGLDIDGLTSANQTKISSGSPSYLPPTPAAILTILDHYKINLSKKHVVIVGGGDLVGKPLSKILVHRGVTVSVATSKTSDLAALTKRADVLVSGVGSPGLITASMVKAGAVVIDAGTTFVSDDGHVRLSGDVDFQNVSGKASWITPVPGGVGPVTVAMLYRNLAISCQRMMS